MPEFFHAAVSDARSLILLDAYFQERAAGFPAEQGVYKPTYPVDESFTEPHGVFFIVVDHGQDVGCGAVRRIDPSDEGLVRFEIKHVWLHPSTRGKGWGRVLLSFLEDAATRLGAEEIVLDTNASLAAAGALYRSTGYVEIEPYNSNPNATTWFAKRLKG